MISCLFVCLHYIAVIELLFCDDMSNMNTWIISDSKHVEDGGGDGRCADPEDTCVRIRGYPNEDCYIKRSIGHTYSRYTLKFDITVYKMEDVNYCRISYSFDDNTYIELVSYQGGGLADDGAVQYLDQVFSFDSNVGNQVYIKLETDGDSDGGNDSCYYDNVCLYGQGLFTTGTTSNTTKTTSSPTGSTASPTENSLSPTIDPTIESTSYYVQIQNRETGKCIFQNSITDEYGATDCDYNDDNQIWKLQNVTNDIRFMNRISGCCIALPRGDNTTHYMTQPDTINYGCNLCSTGYEADNYWTIIPTDSGYFRLRNNHYQACIYHATDGRFGYVYPCGQIIDQQWRFILQIQSPSSSPTMNTQPPTQVTSSPTDEPSQNPTLNPSKQPMMCFIIISHIWSFFGFESQMRKLCIFDTLQFYIKISMIMDVIIIRY